MSKKVKRKHIKQSAASKKVTVNLF